jgi:hypothetical protein
VAAAEAAAAAVVAAAAAAAVHMHEKDGKFIADNDTSSAHHSFPCAHVAQDLLARYDARAEVAPKELEQKLLLDKKHMIR